jgi:crotonobetainyl-CoA:carnitine CoA-transferase CaiB-like acyl-CoA transferase
VCEVVGHPELADDPRFVTQTGRVERQLELEKLLDDRFADRPASHWMRELRARGVPSGPVNTFADVLADPTLHASGFIQPYDVPVAGTSSTTTFPVREVGTPPRIERAPRLGEHTGDVEAEWGVA